MPDGVAHGDLRAPNVFIRPSGEVALVDPDLMREPGEADDRHTLALLGRDLLAADGATTGETTYPFDGSRLVNTAVGAPSSGIRRGC